MDHQPMGGIKIRPAWIVAAGLAVLALVAVGVPLGTLLFVGVLLLCPLLMAGMHGGHGQAHDHETHSAEPGRADPSDSGPPGTRTAGPPREGGPT